MSDENVLLKIHRQFKEDEAFSFLFGFIKNLKFKIGEMKSELEELKDLNKPYIRDKELKKNYANLQKKHEGVCKDLKHYQNLYYAEKVKNERAI